LIQRVLPWAALAILAAFATGCGKGARVSTKTVVPAAAKPVIKDASKEELLDKYNHIALGVKTVNATVELKPTAGSRYSGVIEEYHEVKAFLLAARPARVRMIGQAPVIGTTVFDMASDGETFRVSIPSKNKFLVGQVATERNSSKPIENLRPQHLLDALLWPEIRKEEPVVPEEFNDETARYYVLTVLRGGYRMEILRKVWFDRADLQVVRLQSYGPKGLLLSDIRFSDWQPLPANPGQAGGATGSSGAGTVSSFPRTIRIDRPHDDYRLELQLTKISVNEEIPADRFRLEQPAGSELVRVGENTDNNPPSESNPPEHQR
jgi:outer membrane lipoprotein-sorting protein